ncbi:hypothetical protein A2U01_0013189, partial [Trifolium medium]|nr:hypothetical protein [Trifolium medium]
MQWLFFENLGKKVLSMRERDWMVGNSLLVVIDSRLSEVDGY